MSRVFEALSKAASERRQEAETLDLSFEAEAPFKSPSAVQAFEDSAPRQNGVSHSPPPQQPLTVARSWRERLEELFFGWDLGRYHSHPIVALDKDSPASEQYKILREQIKTLRGDGGIRSFTITSPVKRDGKTTVAVNLSVVLALEYEENVLLIDGDLRAPGVHRYFNTQLSPGLCDYLSSNSTHGIKAYVQDTFLPGLKILPAGKPSSFASELLSQEKMSRAMQEIYAEFPGYQVIVDSPPILSTPDPLVLSRHVDGVLVVVRAGRTPRDYLVKALKILNSTKLMGIVLNGAELGMSSKYYYYTGSGAN